MKIKVLLDENNYATAYAIMGGINGAIEAELPDDSLEHFSNFFNSYCYKDGALHFDELKYKSNKEESIKEQFRIQRNNECFSIVNRGKLWYDLLTEEQIVELNNWYKAWLDVTDTLSAPVKPKWLIEI